MKARWIAMIGLTALAAACGRNTPRADEAAQPIAPATRTATDPLPNLPPPTGPGPGSISAKTNNETARPTPTRQDPQAPQPAGPH